MKDLLHIKTSHLQSVGIVDWGYTEDLLSSSFKNFSEWLKHNHESLGYLGTQQSIYNRENLNHWFPQAQSALVFLFDYTPARKELGDQTKVASYTLGFDGEDYHDVLIPKLRKIAEELNLSNYKFSLDTQPILERDLAYRAGLGWFGKNSMLISPKHGSFFIIGSLILSQKLQIEARGVESDHCGHCLACVDACPTLAINPQSRTIEAKKCISTWTIEDRSPDTPAPKGYETSRGEIFGCDICQDVCPWNRKPLERVTGFLSDKAQFWKEWYAQKPTEILAQLNSFSGRAFQRFVAGTPFSRPGKKTLQRVVSFWVKHDQASE